MVFLLLVNEKKAKKTTITSSPPELFLRKGVLNMQQIYRRTPMPKLLCKFIEITLRHGSFPVNLLHIFRTPFPKNTSGGLLLNLVM